MNKQRILNYLERFEEIECQLNEFKQKMRDNGLFVYTFDNNGKTKSFGTLNIGLFHQYFGGTIVTSLFSENEQTKSYILKLKIDNTTEIYQLMSEEEVNG